MQRFYVTPIKNRGYQAWMVSYPGERKAGSRKARPRKQRMFFDRSRAEAFLRGVEREFVMRKKLLLGQDGEAHMDAIRALEVLAGIPGASLESAAWLLRQCVSSKELRGGGYVVPVNREIKLEGRIFIGLRNAAERQSRSIGSVVEEALWEYLQRQSWLLRECEGISTETEQAKRPELVREYQEQRSLNKSLRKLCPRR
jgi:hypothetical protein